MHCCATIEYLEDHNTRMIKNKTEFQFSVTGVKGKILLRYAVADISILLRTRYCLSYIMHTASYKE